MIHFSSLRKNRFNLKSTIIEVYESLYWLTNYH